MDVKKMVARKDGIVKQFTGGIAALFKANKITAFYGFGQLQPGNIVKVKQHDGSEVELKGTNVVIAAGSDSIELPFAKFGEHIIDNVGALDLEAVPKRLGVIGAGVIGLELGSVWRRLGAEVTVLEALPTFLAATDEGVQKEAWKLLTRQGLKIHLGATIGAVTNDKRGVKVAWTDDQGVGQMLECDRLIVSVGRVPNTDGLGLESVGLSVDERGFIPVDGQCRTAIHNVWAVGDVVRGPMLAHKAEDEGVMVAELIAGQKPHIDYNCIPWVIYTSPEIAWVGRNEQQLRAEGRAYKSGQFPFSINGRALGIGAPEGFVKVLADAVSDEVLGVHVVSAAASDLIAEAVLAMEFKASAEDVGRVSHAHPSMPEVLREAALAASDKRALNM